ncbi:MAG: amidohydrolase family protein [Halioglobus sp.]|nr:amidohydrolase family protein [Halioglobus sp.]
MGVDKNTPNPEGGVSLYSAVRAMAINASWQVFEEHRRGSLEPGKFADFVILEKNPLASTEKMKDPGVHST